MNNGMFRKVALDRLSSPEQLDQLITVTSPRGWLALLTVGCLIIAAILWGIFGSIATKVSGVGMLLDSGRISTVVSTADGQITAVFVATGDVVHPGQMIATLAQPNLQTEIDRLYDEMALSQSQSDHSGRMARLAQLQQQLQQAVQVVSVTGGRVVEVKAAKGDFLRVGTPIVSLKSNQGKEKLEAVLYVSAEEGKKLKAGMEAHIAPSIVKPEEHGFMIGKIMAVSEYPVSAEKMMVSLGSKELVQKFTSAAQGAPVEVQVALIADSSTASGYLWTSLAGSVEQIPGGTICTASVVVKRQQPISMVFLQMNQWLRSE